MLSQVRVNGVRAAGYLLKGLNKECKKELTVSQLVHRFVTSNAAVWLTIQCLFSASSFDHQWTGHEGNTTSYPSCVSNLLTQTRWNACFACYNVFTNAFFIENCQKDMVSIYYRPQPLLCVAISFFFVRQY